MSKNINTNTNIAQIILSDKHEIRLKKKKKKKSNNKKKQALDSVKEALKFYDLAVASAAQKNISLPAELGELPVKIEDINSVKELQQLAIKLNNMTAQINTLIAQGSSQSRTIGLFQEGMIGQSQGVLPTIIQPRILPQQQIPSERPIDIRPIQPIIPSSQPQPQDDSASKALDDIQREILEKLSPEDRQKAEEELEKQKQEQPVQPDQPSIPDEPGIPDEPSVPQPTPPLPDIQPGPPIKPTDLETNLNVEFGTQKIPKLISPVGFYDVFTDYRRYIKDVIFRTKKIVEGQYRINKADETILDQERNKILDKYDTWQEGLNSGQLAYVESDPQLKMVYNEMLKELNLDVGQLAESILQQQGEKITSFEIGDTPVPIEKEVETRLSPQGENFKAQLNQIKTLIEQDKEKSLKSTDLSELNNIIDDLNLIRVNIDNYNKLQPIDKVGLEVLHGDVLDEWNKTIKSVEKRVLDIQKGIPVEIPSSPVDPKQPPQPFSPPAPKSREEVEKERVEAQFKSDKDLLNNFIEDPKVRFTNQIIESLKRMPKNEIIVEKIVAIKSSTSPSKKKDAKKEILKYLRSQKLLDVKRKPNLVMKQGAKKLPVEQLDMSKIGLRTWPPFGKSAPVAAGPAPIE